MKRSVFFSILLFALISFISATTIIVSATTTIGDNLINTTGNITGLYFIGDGSQLTNIPSSDNSSFNESYTDTLYAGITESLWTSNQSLYYTSAQVEGFGYYNDSDFDIADYYTSSQIDSFSYYNSTNPQPGVNSSWNQSLADTIYVPYTGASSNINLGTNNFTIDTDTLHIDSTNNRVGIGITSPNQELEIVGTIDADGLIISNSTELTSVSTGTGDNDKLVTQGYVDDNDADTIYSAGSGLNLFSTTFKLGGTITANTDFNLYGSSADRSIRFYNSDSGDELLFLNGSTGYVGIGTTSPGEKLQVNGNIVLGSGGNSLYLSNGAYLFSSGTNGASSSFYHGTNDYMVYGSGGTMYVDTMGFQFSHMAQDFTFHSLLETDDDEQRYSKLRFTGERVGDDIHELASIRADHEGSGADYKGRLRFYTNDGNDSEDALTARLTITSNGNVGIGTTEPDANLDISGNIIVSDLSGSYGSGSAYVCVYDNGTLFASDSACP